MRLSKATMLALGSLAVAGAGYVYKTLVDHRDKVFDKKLTEQELEILEGEGGICLS